MQPRFRIRTPEGLELEPRTLEIFSELVRSGVVRPQDLVFDALTARWVEAGEHPMVRLFQDPFTDEASTRSRTLGLDLVESSTPTPGEAEARFIRMMEEERRNDPERAPMALEIPIVAGEPRAAAPGDEDADPPAEEARGDARAPALVLAPPRGRSSRPSPWWGRAALAGAAVAGVAVVVGLVSLRAPESPAATAPAAAESPAALAVRAEGATQDAARGAFLAQVSQLRDQAGLAEVPAVWLEGRYLADAAAHPEVRSYWEGVRAFVDVVQRGEEDRYREAWLGTAGAVGMSGPVRSLRLATALEDFAARTPVRAEHYARVREVAASALALHDLLVGLGNRVTYEPLRGAGLSADPVLEAAGADPAAQTLLEDALDRVLAALKGPGGDLLRDRARLAAWVADVPF